MRSAQHEVIVISPYFVPGEAGVALMRELTGRGVRIRILTNSLASTDSPLVHNGYARYRVALLKLGVELSEVRPQLGQKRPRFHPFRSSHASLHAKALVIDQKTVFIGSLNMDGRSARLNSELGLVIHSSEIARQVTSLLDDLSADGSYRLALDSRGRIVWSSGEPGEERIWHKDPETTLLQRIHARSARAVRTRGDAVSAAAQGGRRMVPEVVLDPAAKPFAAGDGRAAGQHQNEVAAQRAVHLAHVIHIDQTGAADAQHRLRAHGELRLAQGAARMIIVATHPYDDVVPVRLDHLHLRDVDHVQATVEFREQPRAILGRAARAALQLCEQACQQRLAVRRPARQVARAHARQRFAEALLIERLQQVIDGAHLERLQRVCVVGGHEHQGGQFIRGERARQIDAVQRIHLDVEKQQLRPLRSDLRERLGTVAVLADHAQVALRFAQFAQRAPPGLLVVDDDDVHHAAAIGAAPLASRRSGES